MFARGEKLMQERLEAGILLARIPFLKFGFKIVVLIREERKVSFGAANVTG
jgi:hypothetical protein